jgi:hypothetical protein
MSDKKHTEPSADEPRARQQRRPNHPRKTYKTADELEALLSSSFTTEGQRNVITQALLILANNLNFSLASPEIVRQVFLELRRKQVEIQDEGTPKERYRLRIAIHWVFNALDAIKEGKTFDGFTGARDELLTLFGTPDFVAYDGDEIVEGWPSASGEEWSEALKRLKHNPLSDLYDSPEEKGRPRERGATDQNRITERRRRLQELLDEGEAHNESNIFRLEREIYDLEHPTDDDDILSAEVIGEGGER